MISARGRLRSGSLTSPPTNDRSPHPSYAHITDTSASPNRPPRTGPPRSEDHTSELQSQSNLVCRLLLEKKKNTKRLSTSAVTFQLGSLLANSSRLRR